MVVEEVVPTTIRTSKGGTIVPVVLSPWVAWWPL